MLSNKLISLDLCLPVYNEATILASNVQRIVDFISNNRLPITCRLVILVNGSTDQSAVIAQQLAQQWPDLISYENYSIASKGRSLLTYASQTKADWWGFLDIDLAVDVTDLSTIFQAISQETADLVIGSRLLPGSVYQRHWSRRLVSRAYNYLIHLTLRTHISDHQCGCKFVRSDWWLKLQPHIQKTDWFLDTEMIAWTRQLGGRIIELPVNWINDRYGCRKSKVHLIRDTFSLLTALKKLRQRLIKNKNK